MSMEDRLTRLENLMETVVESQVKNEIGIENLLKSQEAQDRQISELTKVTRRTSESLEGVSRSISRLADMQERTEERLLDLIEHVDGIEARLKRVERFKN